MLSLSRRCLTERQLYPHSYAHYTTASTLPRECSPTRIRYLPIRAYVFKVNYPIVESLTDSLAQSASSELVLRCEKSETTGDWSAELLAFHTFGQTEYIDELTAVTAIPTENIEPLLGESLHTRTSLDIQIASLTTAQKHKLFEDVDFIFVFDATDKRIPAWH